MSDPEILKGVLGLWICKDGLNNFLDEHAGRDDATGLEPDCRCVQCDEVRGLLFMVRMALERVENQLGRFGREMQRVRGVCLPAVYDLLAALQRLREPKEGPEDPDA